MFKPLSIGFRRATRSGYGNSHLFRNSSNVGLSLSVRGCAVTQTSNDSTSLHETLVAISERKSQGSYPRFPVTSTSHLPAESAMLLSRLRMDIYRSGVTYAPFLLRFIDSLTQDCKLGDQDALFLITCCGNALPESTLQERVDIFNRLLETLSKCGVKFTLDHFNVILSMYKENEISLDPKAYAEQMKSENVFPSQNTYELMISCCASVGDLQRASELLTTMKEMQMPITERTFSALICAYLKKKDTASADSIEDVMKARGIRPESLTYAAKLNAYVENGEYDRAKEILNEISSKGIFLSDEDLLEAAYKCCKAGHEEILEDLLSNLRRQLGFLVKIKRTSLRMATDGHFDGAYKVLRALGHGGQMAIRSAATVDRLLRHMIGKESPSVVCDMCQRMKEEEVYNDSFTSALRLSVLTKNFEMAEAILRRMVSLNFEIRLNYFWPLFCMKSASDECSLKTLRLMDELNVPITMVTMAEWFWPNAPAAITCESLLAQQGDLKLNQNFLNVSYLCHLLKTADANAAVEHVDKHRFTVVATAKVLEYLIGLFHRERDLETAVALLARLNGKLGADTTPADFNGQLLNRVITLLPDNRLMVVLENMILRNLRITPAILETMLSRGVVVESGKVHEKLQLLTVGQAQEAVDESVEKIINDYKTGGQSVSIRAERLLRNMINESNYEAASELHKFLKEHYPSSGAAFDKQMVQLCVSCKRIDEALARFSSIDPDLNAAVRLCTALIVDNRFADCVGLLKTFQSRLNTVNAKAASANVNSFLTELVNRVSPADVCEVVDTLLQAGYLTSVNAPLSKCQRLYLNSGHVDKAVEFFNASRSRFRRVPFALDLLTALIKSENSPLLQTVYESVAELRGDVHAWTMVALALTAAGRADQANQLIKKRRTLDNNLLTVFCKGRVLDGKINELESLLKATDGVDEISRDLLYCYLLIACRNAKSVQRAKNAWSTMKAQQLQPSARTLLLFDAIFAESHEQPPDDLQQLLKAHKAASDVQSDSETLSSVYATLPTCQVNTLINQGDLGAALELYVDLARSGNQMIPLSLTRRLFNMLREKNDYQSMSRLKGLLTSSQVIAINANYLITEAMIKSGEVDRFLRPLEENVSAKCSPGLLADLVSFNSDLESRVKSYADRAWLVKNPIPNVALWMYYSINGRSQDAESIAQQLGPKVLITNCRHLYLLTRACKANRQEVVDQTISWIQKYAPDQLSSAVARVIHEYGLLGNKEVVERMVKFAEKANCNDSVSYRSSIARLTKLSQSDDKLAAADEDDDVDVTTESEMSTESNK